MAIKDYGKGARKSTSNKQEKMFICNKAAQLLSMVFVIEYPHKWMTFFTDLHRLLSYGVKAVDLYLRILMAIDSEVVDREIVHTTEDAQRNTLIKDAMREQCIPEMVEMWYMILRTYENSSSEVTCLCLEVIGAYVSWIDISLIANERFITLLLHHLSVDVLRESACDCLHEIISKGMNPMAKTQLVESLVSVLERAHILPPAQDEDIDFVAKLAKLINGVGTNLLVSWNKLLKSGNEVDAEKTFQAIDNKVSLMLRFLGDEDDDISLAVTEFAHDYVTTLKQVSCMQFVWLQWETLVFTKVELAVRFLYNLGEAIPANQSNHFMGDSPKVIAMKEMMSTLVRSGVVGHSHFAVGLQVFETFARYDKFFNLTPQHIPEVIAAFLDERGMRNPNAMLRSRTSYLFSRFVKSTRQHLHPYTDEILKTLATFMVAAPPDNGHSMLLSNDDKLFIYESAGVLIVASQFPPEKKQLQMKTLLSPLIQKFNTMLTKLCAECDEAQQLVYAEIVSQCISFASRTSKAFHSQQTMTQCGCDVCYIEALQVFLLAMNTPYQRQIVHSAVRQYLHRMIVCLEGDVLPYIPIAVENLLKSSCTAKDIQEFIPLINQIISKFKYGFRDFIYERIIPTCFLAPLKSTFDLGDGQTYLALQEDGALLKTVVSKQGRNAYRFLQEEYLPSLQISPGLSQEFCEALQQTDLKVFRNYFKVFLLRLKS
uniref:Exportin-T n=1 Tax=Saccoglossus kowalevskii TaxID=10224 RepID=A0ABM0MC47_SACKO|nr:PREDICTED: exportin-T-like [Saccoglossus kowalevskii]